MPKDTAQWNAGQIRVLERDPTLSTPMESSISVGPSCIESERMVKVI